jgi:hypothetical protein
LTEAVEPPSSVAASVAAQPSTSHTQRGALAWRQHLNGGDKSELHSLAWNPSAIVWFTLPGCWLLRRLAYRSRSGCRSFKPSILRRGCGPPTARRVLQGPAAAQGGDAADQVGAGQFRIRRPRVACWWRGRPNQERSSKNCAPAGTASAEPATTIASMIANRCKIRVLLGLVINLRRGEFFA